MKNTISMNVSAIGTDDGKSTFEVQRTWNEKELSELLQILPDTEQD